MVETMSQEGCIVKSKFVVRNSKGIHTRPATEIVKTASTYSCEIRLKYRDFQVNAKSILGVLLLAAGRGARVLVEAEGIDAGQAVENLLHLAENKFFIEY